MKRRQAIILNIVVPGAGLIALRREWLGFAVALLFTVYAQTAVVGFLIAPAEIPPWLTGTGLAGTILIWCWCQWLLWRHLENDTSPDLQRELEVLSQRSDEAAAAGNYTEAYDLLRAALTINDEHETLNRKFAHTATRIGRREEAIEAWRRVLQLTHEDQTRREAVAALAELQHD